MTVPQQSCMFQRVAQERKLLYETFERLDRGEEVDFEIFRGVLGVVMEDEPITWEQLRASLELGTDEAMGILGRTVFQIKEYFQHRDRVLLKQYASITDYLYNRVFGVPLRLGEDGRKLAVLPPDFYSELRVVWRNNDYPYYFETGVEHHNVWANHPLSTQELEQFIADNRQGYETLHYINPPALQSVPAIWHAHVISRRLPASSR